MTLSDFRNDPSWKGAIDLGPKLVQLAEDVPAAEEQGLSRELRGLMVELPAAIAADKLYGTQTCRAPMLRLLAALELIDKVYPALDTAAARDAADHLGDQLLADPGQQQSASEELHPEAPAEPADPAAESHSEEGEAPQPNSVPLVPTDMPEAPQPPAAPTHVQITQAPNHSDA